MTYLVKQDGIELGRPVAWQSMAHTLVAKIKQAFHYAHVSDHVQHGARCLRRVEQPHNDGTPQFGIGYNSRHGGW